MDMKKITTSRGFKRIEFKDSYDTDCSLQESSLATEDAIWFGCNHGTHVGAKCLARMHLTREQVSHLIPLLQCFVETGRLLTAAFEDEEDVLRKWGEKDDQSL